MSANTNKRTFRSVCVSAIVNDIFGIQESKILCEDCPRQVLIQLRLTFYYYWEIRHLSMFLLLIIKNPSSIYPIFFALENISPWRYSLYFYISRKERIKSLSFLSLKLFRLKSLFNCFLLIDLNFWGVSFPFGYFPISIYYWKRGTRYFSTGLFSGPLELLMRHAFFTPNFLKLSVHNFKVESWILLICPTSSYFYSGPMTFLLSIPLFFALFYKIFF